MPAEAAAFWTGWLSLGLLGTAPVPGTSALESAEEGRVDTMSLLLRLPVSKAKWLSRSAEVSLEPWLPGRAAARPCGTALPFLGPGAA